MTAGAGRAGRHCHPVTGGTDWAVNAVTTANDYLPRKLSFDAAGTLQVTHSRQPGSVFAEVVDGEYTSSQFSGVLSLSGWLTDGCMETEVLHQDLMRSFPGEATEQITWVRLRDPRRG